MTKTKRIIAFMLVLVTLFGIMSIGTQAATHIGEKNLKFGYILPTNSSYKKALPTVKLYGNYDYMYFYINSKAKSSIFAYQIYSDSSFTKLVESGFISPEKKGEICENIKIKLSGTYKNGTYYGLCYAAKRMENGDTYIDQSSLYGFEIKVDKTPENMSDQLVAIKSLTATKNGPVIKWHKVKDAVKYVIYRKVDSGEKEKIASVKSGTYSYTDKGMANKAGKVKYIIYAYDKNGKKSSAYPYATIIYLGTPKLISAENRANDFIAVTAEKSPNTAYLVYRKTDKTDWEELSYSPTEKIIDNQKKETNTKYSYKVRYRINRDNKSYIGDYFSNTVSLTYLSAPKVTITNRNDQGTNLIWTPVEGATKYVIIRRDYPDGKKWTKIGSVNSNTLEFTDTTAEEGFHYLYSVRADGDGYKGSYDGNSGISYYLETPEIKKITREGNKLKIYYNAVEYADSYDILYRKDNGEWKSAKTFTRYYSYLLYEPESFGNVEYAIQALRDNNLKSEPSEPVSYKFYPKLIDFKTTIYSNKIKLSWEKFDKVDKYEIYRTTASDNPEVTPEPVLLATLSPDKHSYTDKTALDSVEYTYTVKQYADGKMIKYDAQTTVKRLPPDKYLTFDQVWLIREEDLYGGYIDINSNTSGIEKTIWYKKKNDWYEIGSSSKGSWTEQITLSDRYSEDAVAITYTTEEGTAPIDAHNYKFKKESEIYLEGVTVKTNDKGFKLTWNAVKGIEQYSITIINNLTGKTKTVTVKYNGKQTISKMFSHDHTYDAEYTIYIDAITGTNSKIRFAYTIAFPRAPKLVKAYKDKFDNVVVLWEKPTDMHFKSSSFYVYRREAGETEWTRIKSIYGSPDTMKTKKNGVCYYYTDKKADPNKKYYYTVKHSTPNPGRGIYIIKSYYDKEGIVYKP